MPPKMLSIGPSLSAIGFIVINRAKFLIYNSDFLSIPTLRFLLTFIKYLFRKKMEAPLLYFSKFNKNACKHQPQQYPYYCFSIIIYFAFHVRAPRRQETLFWQFTSIMTCAYLFRFYYHLTLFWRYNQCKNQILVCILV